MRVREILQDMVKPLYIKKNSDHPFEPFSILDICICLRLVLVHLHGEGQGEDPRARHLPRQEHRSDQHTKALRKDNI